MESSRYKFKLWFDRFLSKSLWKQFTLVFAFLVGALALSYMILPVWSDNWNEVCISNNINRWLLPVYLLIDSGAICNIYIDDQNVPADSWTLLASSITFLLGAFIFNGFIIAIITNSIERRVANHRSGHIHYLKSGHYVIMGYDDMVPSIVLHIFEKDRDAFVLLMSALDLDVIREKLRKVFDEEHLKHIIINYGQRISKDYYNDIHLESAKKVYIVGQRSLPSHDAINVECVDSICDYLEQPEVKERPSRITCVFEDLDTYAAFKTSEIFDRVKNLGIEFVPYNFYSGWAKQVFVRQYHTDKDRPGRQIPYPSVYGNGIMAGDDTALTEDDKRYAHLVFVGTTNFAVAFAMEAAYLLHFPNASGGGRVKTRITFIDKNADKEKDEFIVRNRHFFEIQSYYYQDLSDDSTCTAQRVMKETLFFTPENGYAEKDTDFLDVEFEFIKGDIFSHTVQKVIAGWATEHNETQYLSLFLAMPDQHRNFVMGMNMPDIVYDNQVPIFIRQDHSDNFVTNLREADQAIAKQNKKNTYYSVENGKLKTGKPQGGRYANIYPFGMNETAYCADDDLLKGAKLVNYLYYTMTPDGRFQSITVLDSLSKEQIWNDAERYWRDYLTVALKWSNLYSSYNIRVRQAVLRSLRGLAMDDTSLDMSPVTEAEAEILAKVEHNRWNVEKLLMGFRKPHKEEDGYEYQDDKDLKDKLKLNKNRFIHHDIRPYEELDDVKELDKEFSRYIPWIVRMTGGL